MKQYQMKNGIIRFCKLPVDKLFRLRERKFEPNMKLLNEFFIAVIRDL